MRKLIAAVAFVFLSTLAFGQTTAVVTGNLVDQSETGTSSGISVDVTLVNTGSQRCFVNGTGTVVTEKKNYTAAQILAGITLAKTANVTCGATSGQTRWRFTFKNSALNTSRDCDLQISGATSLNTATCLQATTTPTTTVPTSSLFLLLDGSNSMIGNLVPAVNGTQSIGTSGSRWNMFANTLDVSGNETVAGLASLKNLNNIQFASQYSGADWCAKVSAADTALGQKGGQIWVDKSAGTSCAAGFTLRNSLVFIDDADYSVRTITIGTGGISLQGMGLANVGSSPFGTRLVYVGSAGSDIISIVGSSGAQLDKISLSNLILDGNNTARYTLLAQWVNAGTVRDVRFQGAATAGTYFQTSIDWKFYNVGWTFCQGSSGAGYCAIWDGGSGNNHIYGGQTEQGAASTNPQFVFSGSINSFEISGLDFDSCTPFGGFILIQGQDGVNSSFAGALTGIGQGRPINLDIHPGFVNYCAGATAAAQGADILITDASAAQKPTKIHLHDIQLSGIAATSQVGIKIDQASDIQINDIISTGHTAGTAATVQTTANSSLIRMTNVASGDTNRFVAAAEVPMDCQQVSASNATWMQCNGGRRLGAGTAVLPSLTLSGTGADTGTGWWSPAAGYWCYSSGSSNTFCFTPSGPVTGGGKVAGLANGDAFSSTCATGVGWLAQGLTGVGNSCSSPNKAGFIQAGNTVRLTADFTDASSTALQTITGLSWTLPAFANSYNFHCSLSYSQATAAVADAFGVQGATTVPTNLVANGLVYTAAGTSTSGNSGNITTTTATNVLTFTPSATATVFMAQLDGQIEVGASGSTLNIMVSQSTAGDLITIKRGSYCQLF